MMPIALMMTTTGTGRCSTSLEHVFPNPLKCWWHRGPGSCTQATVACTRKTTAGQSGPCRKWRKIWRMSKKICFLPQSLSPRQKWQSISLTWRMEAGEMFATTVSAKTMPNAFNSSLNILYVPFAANVSGVHPFLIVLQNCPNVEQNVIAKDFILL